VRAPTKWWTDLPRGERIAILILACTFLGVIITYAGVANAAGWPPFKPGPSPSASLCAGCPTATAPPTVTPLAPTVPPPSQTLSSTCPSGPTYLDALTPQSGTPPETGVGSFAGQTYPNSIIYPLNVTHDSYQTTYALCGHYHRFQGTLGFDSDANVSIELVGDNNRVLFDASRPQANTPISIDVDITGSQFLTLVVQLECCLSNVVWGDAKVS
jgi:hypothetical protein